MEDFEETVGKIWEKFSVNYYCFTRKMNTYVFFVNGGFPQCLLEEMQVYNRRLGNTGSYTKLTTVLDYL